MKKFIKWLLYCIGGFFAFLLLIGILAISCGSTDKTKKSTDKTASTGVVVQNDGLKIPKLKELTKQEIAARENARLKVSFENLEPDGIKHVLEKAGADVTKVSTKPVVWDKLGYSSENCLTTAPDWVGRGDHLVGGIDGITKVECQKLIVNKRVGVFVLVDQKAMFDADSFLKRTRYSSSKVFQALAKNPRILFIHVTYTLEFTDMYGNSKQDVAYLVDSVAKNNDYTTVTKINWEGFNMENFPVLFDEYIHGAVNKETTEFKKGWEKYNNRQVIEIIR